MTVLVATNNAHKKRELQALLSGWELLLPADVGGVGWDHEETADTFLGNSLGKARSLWKATGGRWPVLADDSGLCVDALGGAPGVYSARYGHAEAGRPLSDAEKNARLLGALGERNDRSARFVCTLALVVAEHRVFTVEESWEGEIAPSVEGAQGFGYDPVFLLPSLGLTSAQLSPEQKNQLSHRGRACHRLRALVHDLDMPKE